MARRHSRRTATRWPSQGRMKRASGTFGFAISTDSTPRRWTAQKARRNHSGRRIADRSDSSRAGSCGDGGFWRRAARSCGCIVASRRYVVQGQHHHFCAAPGLGTLSRPCDRRTSRPGYAARRVDTRDRSPVAARTARRQARSSPRPNGQGDAPPTRPRGGRPRGRQLETASGYGLDRCRCRWTSALSARQHVVRTAFRPRDWWTVGRSRSHCRAGLAGGHGWIGRFDAVERAIAWRPGIEGHPQMTWVDSLGQRLNTIGPPRLKVRLLPRTAAQLSWPPRRAIADRRTVALGFRRGHDGQTPPYASGSSPVWSPTGVTSGGPRRLVRHDLRCVDQGTRWRRRRARTRRVAPHESACELVA